MKIIAGQYKGRVLHAPKGRDTRPTSARVREAIFNLLPHTLQDMYIFDVFCGTGALGLEALSRGAAHAGFMDVSCSMVRQNIRALGCDDTAFAVQGDAFQQGLLVKAMSAMPAPVDVLFLDPPYHKGLVDKILSYADTMPLVDDAFIVTEHETGHVPTYPKSIEIWKQRPYGDTTITIYARA